MVEARGSQVVRPRITLSGISGLSTLLSGSYIARRRQVNLKARSFTGLSAAIVGGQPGGRSLKAADLGSLGIGSPIYYRRLPVGPITAYSSPDGKASTKCSSHHDKYVKPGTRFWCERAGRIARREWDDVRTSP
jgi:paraquat-inducible protein B